jgi:hypothetical protein
VLVSAVQSTCAKWVCLITEYRNAVLEYGAAAIPLGCGSAADFNSAWEASELARKKCEELRDALLEHEYEHGCVC